MKNVTIALDEEVARWARIFAARHNTSVSRFLGEILRERMLQEEGYEQAMSLFFSVAPRVLTPTGPYPRREELYDRPGLRRHQRSGVRARR